MLHELGHALSMDHGNRRLSDEERAILLEAPQAADFFYSKENHKDFDEEKIARNFAYWAQRGLAGYGTEEHTMFKPYEQARIENPNATNEQIRIDVSNRRRWNKIIRKKYQDKEGNIRTDEPWLMEQFDIYRKILDGEYKQDAPND